MRRLLCLVTMTLTFLPILAPAASATDWITDQGPDGSGYIPAPRPITHSLRWSTKLSDLPSGIFPLSPLLTFDNKVYVNGAGTNSVLALDARTGEVVWRFAPDPRKSGAFGGYPNANQPQIANGIYYTTANNGFLYALDAKTGHKVWSFQVTGTEYNKTIARVAVCGGRVFFDSLGGVPDKGQKNVYAVDARTGKLAWSTYAGAPHFPGDGAWPDFPHNPNADDLANLGRSTRRFEARPGLACSKNRVQVYGEDGVLRLLDAGSGQVRGEYDVLHSDMDLGYAVDGAVGLTDPVTGDFLRASLNNRLVRLVPSAMETVCGGKVCGDLQQEELKVAPGWRHPYGDCADTKIKCGVVSVGRGDVLPTYTKTRNDGVVGGAIFSAGMAIAPVGNHRIVYSANHDGYLYAMDFDNPIVDGQPSQFKVPFDTIPDSIRDAPYSLRRDGENLYESNDGSHCAKASNCTNGPWEHRASNVSSPLVAGSVVYVAASMAHKMLGFDATTGQKVFEFEVKWDDTAQYPPFGDVKPKPLVDLDLLVQTTPAHDGKNLYFAANNGVVYCISTQEVISKPRKNLAILGSGIVPFIPKWQEQLGAFDYVWTPQGDWYNPGYTSPDSITSKQAPPGFTDSSLPFGYKGASRGPGAMVPWLLIAGAMVLVAMAFPTKRLVSSGGLGFQSVPRFRREFRVLLMAAIAAILVVSLMHLTWRERRDDIDPFKGLQIKPGAPSLMTGDR